MLTSISLQQFRSYHSYNCKIHPQLTYIVGPNTAGKTNILEAIALLSIGKSFRGVLDREMIQWEQEFGRVIITTDDDKLEITLTSGIVAGKKTQKKRYTVNGVGRRMSDTVTNLPTVLFAPEDLDLIHGSPSLRRKFLDQILVQIDAHYYRHMQRYEKALRQRNKLLSFIHDELATREELEYWDTLLIESGRMIHEARNAYIAFQNTIPFESKQFHIVYDHSIISKERLYQYAEEEIAARTTLVGPHRDDIQIDIQKTYESKKSYVSLDRNGSRGEQRLAVLWLKIGALHYIHTTLKQLPLLLLDDIFSELDDAHRHVVISLLSSYQTILTSADPDLVQEISDIYPGKIIEL